MMQPSVAVAKKERGKVQSAHPLEMSAGASDCARSAPPADDGLQLGIKKACLRTPSVTADRVCEIDTLADLVKPMLTVLR
ncbi:hypothetical protein Y887_09520 [Xanthomonas pisi DSM 18956]|uniref:Uncharacterized protein n=1 Tax=Xanthomonas pisi TaxID=56457 RepID=A0A2S7CWN3_9XANT|nr:hypothetical protein Y887_09520 [Xanthomonas pisi DSM 18956]PPU65894.1 hypothetical protein XpiCFBP4643_19775 [Xanthomonas pisi]